MDHETGHQLPRVVPGECLMCAVRQLTEGDAPLWHWREPGDQVTGVMIRVEHSNWTTPTAVTLWTGGTAVGITPTAVTLWTGGTDRVRVQSANTVFIHQLHAAAPRLGDRVTIQYLGERMIERGLMTGQFANHWRVTVERGHHVTDINVQPRGH